MEGRHYIDFPFCSRSFFEIHCKVIRAPTNLSKGKLFTKPSFQNRLINFPLHFAVISLRRSPITRWRVSLPFSPLLSPPFFLNQSVLVPTCLTITVENRSSDDRPGSWGRRNLMEEIRGDRRDDLLTGNGTITIVSLVSWIDCVESLRLGNVFNYDSC